MTEVIPAIIAKDFQELKRKIKLVEPYSEWVQLDIMDGRFVPNTTWNKPEDLRAAGFSVFLEVHLMIQEPEKYLDSWIESGIKRVIVHVEAAENFKKIIEKCRQRKREISNYLKEIERIIKERDFNFPESFLLLPSEKINFPEKNFQNLKLIIVVGIGGSSLGAQAIFESLKKKKKLKEILFLDSLNPILLREIGDRFKSGEIKKEESLVCLISKSGKTFETVANFFVFLKIVKRYLPRTSVITDENSPLWHFGERKGYQLLTIPKMVGGRYSVFSNVGLFPLVLSGVDVQELFSGAKMANEICLINNPLKNPALSSALTIFYHWKNGKNIYGNLVFPPDLEFFGRWYVQLIAESLGKDGKGITPIVTVGTTDFHAIGQLFFDGPKDKLINFVFVEDLGIDFKIPQDSKALFPGSQGKKIWQVNKAIYQGVKRAYLKKKLPFTETVLEKLDEKNLDFLFQMKMIEIIFLAKLMKVNAFDQPGVELYKKETREILKK